MNEDKAKARFMLLNLVRLSGVALMFAGLANVSGKLLPELAPVLGGVLMVVAMADFFVAPMILKKIWQNQDR